MTARHGGFGAAFAAPALGLLVGVAFTPASAMAQAVDGRWLPFVGCWQPEEDGEDADGLCVLPTADGVRLVTVRGTDVVDSRTLSADRESIVRRDGCGVVERADFSDNLARVYVHSRQECGAGVREFTGILAMASPTELLEVRTVSSDAQDAAVVKRYQGTSASLATDAGLADPSQGRASAIESARMSASATLSVDDIIEAADAVDAEAVKALIAERNQPLGFEAEDLVRLADAGVPEDVIDVAVAVSYPDHFEVASIDREGAYRYGRYGPYGRDSYYPVGYWRIGYGWGFGLAFPYYYDPFWGYRGYYGYPGYYGYGYGGYYRWPRGGIVVVRPSDGHPDLGRGRAVKGRGYTRPGSGTSGKPPAVRRPSGGSSGGAVRSGSSSTRHAKPRPNGGGTVNRQARAPTPVHVKAPSRGSSIPRHARPRPGGGSGQ